MPKTTPLNRDTIFLHYLRPHKGFLKKETHNPNAQATQNYSIVEDLA